MRRRSRRPTAHNRFRIGASTGSGGALGRDFEHSRANPRETAVEPKAWQLTVSGYGRGQRGQNMVAGVGNPQTRAQIKTLEARRADSDRSADFLRTGGHA